MFDERKAQRVTGFIECLRHTKGEFHGKPFKLLPWQEKIIRDVFGTVRDDDPTMRQYTTAYIEIPKKQGKSELGAAIALNMLANDDEWKAEVYSCASDRQQAAIVFDVAVDMVKQSPALSKRIKIIPSMKRMVYQPTGSIYQVLSSEVATKHGLNVSACIFDELHTQPTRALYDVMTQGSGDARKQPLWFFLTTAGTDRNSICWEVHQKALDVLEGRKVDPRFYPVIFGLPDDADWTSEANWYKANPSLGHTITIDKVRDAFHKAQETPADENQFRQLRLNQWVKQSIRWMPMDKWDECGGVVDPYQLEGRACYAGLDLSSTSDLTALVLVFPPSNEDEPYTVMPFFWLPEETLSLRVRRDHVPYDQWAKRGYIHTTEGNVVHYGFIEQFICQLGERYNIREIAHDRWNATMMVQTLEDDGFTMVPFGQGFKDMSPPTKELMRLVLEHKLCHGGHPVLRWNMDNAVFMTNDATMKVLRQLKNGNGDCLVTPGVNDGDDLNCLFRFIHPEVYKKVPDCSDPNALRTPGLFLHQWNAFRHLRKRSHHCTQSLNGTFCGFRRQKFLRDIISDLTQMCLRLKRYSNFVLHASDSSKQVVHCVIQRNGFICFRLLQANAHHRVKVRIAHGIAGDGMRRHRHGKRHSAPHDDLSVQRIDQHRNRETELRQDALGLLFNFRLNASHYIGTLSHTITPFN